MVGKHHRNQDISVIGRNIELNDWLGKWRQMSNYHQENQGHSHRVDNLRQLFTIHN